MSEPMIAIEFQARIKDGTIEVPIEFREQLSGTVRVIILRTEPQKTSKIIERLLKHPIQDPTFTPLRRDEVHCERSPEWCTNDLLGRYAT